MLPGLPKYIKNTDIFKELPSSTVRQKKDPTDLMRTHGTNSCQLFCFCHGRVWSISTYKTNHANLDKNSQKLKPAQQEFN